MVSSVEKRFSLYILYIYSFPVCFCQSKPGLGLGLKILPLPGKTPHRAHSTRPEGSLRQSPHRQMSSTPFLWRAIKKRKIHKIMKGSKMCENKRNTMWNLLMTSPQGKHSFIVLIGLSLSSGSTGGQLEPIPATIGPRQDTLDDVYLILTGIFS